MNMKVTHNALEGNINQKTANILDEIGVIDLIHNSISYLKSLEDLGHLEFSGNRRDFVDGLFKADNFITKFENKFSEEKLKINDDISKKDFGENVKFLIDGLKQNLTYDVVNGFMPISFDQDKAVGVNRAGGEADLLAMIVEVSGARSEKARWKLFDEIESARNAKQVIDIINPLLDKAFANILGKISKETGLPKPDQIKHEKIKQGDENISLGSQGVEKAATGAMKVLKGSKNKNSKKSSIENGAIDSAIAEDLVAPQIREILDVLQQGAVPKQGKDGGKGKIIKLR